ncbi:MAG: hypothetical protein EBR55_10900, partial [Chitinophagia bacterium]|nr:hypothetical protein [Chitinophagia bacterium]
MDQNALFSVMITRFESRRHCMKIKYKKYRVYLDKPGCGWEIVVKAKSAKNALINANSKNPFNPTTIDSVEELSKEKIKSEKVWNLIKEYRRKLNDLKTEYEKNLQKVREDAEKIKTVNKLFT